MTKEHEAILLQIEQGVAEKMEIFDLLFKKTMEQNQILTEREVDMDVFEGLMKKKDEWMKDLETVDAALDAAIEAGRPLFGVGLEGIHDRVAVVREQVEKLNHVAQSMGDLERKNKHLLANYLHSKRNDIQQFRRTKAATNRYSQNMKDAHQSDMSYFMDRKK